MNDIPAHILGRHVFYYLTLEELTGALVISHHFHEAALIALNHGPYVLTIRGPSSRPIGLCRDSSSRPIAPPIEPIRVRLVGPLGLQSWAPLRGLVSIHLKATGITIEGLNRILKGRHLRALTLHKEALSPALEWPQWLTSLALIGIEKKGVIEAILAPMALERLYLEDVGGTDVNHDKILNRLLSIPGLELDCRWLTERPLFIAALGANRVTNLVKIHTSASDYSTQLISTLLSMNTNLTDFSISLSGVNSTIGQQQWWPHFPHNLRRVHLYKFRISSINCLRAFSNIEEVSLIDFVLMGAPSVDLLFLMESRTRPLRVLKMATYINSDINKMDNIGPLLHHPMSQLVTLEIRSREDVGNFILDNVQTSLRNLEIYYRDNNNFDKIGRLNLRRLETNGALLFGLSLAAFGGIEKVIIHEAHGLDNEDLRHLNRALYVSIRGANRLSNESLVHLKGARKVNIAGHYLDPDAAPQAFLEGPYSIIINGKKVK